MDRNYNLELMNPVLEKQIKNEAHLTCGGTLE